MIEPKYLEREADCQLLSSGLICEWIATYIQGDPEEYVNYRGYINQVILNKEHITYENGPNSEVLKGTKSKIKVVTVYAIKAYRGSRITAPLILNLGSRWSWIVNFTPCPLYTPRKNPSTH